MNMNVDVAEMLNKVLTRGREIAEGRNDLARIEQVSQWAERRDRIMAGDDPQLVNRELTSLWNETWPIIDRWERGSL